MIFARRVGAVFDRGFVAGRLVLDGVILNLGFLLVGSLFRVGFDFAFAFSFPFDFSGFELRFGNITVASPSISAGHEISKHVIVVGAPIVIGGWSPTCASFVIAVLKVVDHGALCWLASRTICLSTSAHSRVVRSLAILHLCSRFHFSFVRCLRFLGVWYWYRY